MLANVGVERAVIAAICQFGSEALLEIEDLGINSESFTSSSNHALYACLKKVLDRKENVDPPSLIEEIHNTGYTQLFSKRKDIEYVGSLFDFSVNKDNVRNFGKKLQKITIARSAIKKHQEAIEKLNNVKGTEDIEEIMAMSESPVFDLIMDMNQHKTRGPHILYEKVEDLVKYLEENKTDNIGIPTPWTTFNSVIGGGLRRGGVHLIGARPKCGKTTLAKESLIHFTQKLKIPSLFLDTEMVLQDQVIRSLSSISKVSLEHIETGQFVDHYLNKQNVHEAAKQLKENKLLWYESIFGKSFDEVLAIIRRWIVKNVGFYDDGGGTKECVVVYDYFKLMNQGQMGNLQEYQALGFQISRMTDFCKEFDFPCLAFVQLNRQHDISQSDRLRWLCNSYSTFERKTADEIQEDGPEGGNRKSRTEDTRFGSGIPDENDYICFNFQGNINTITELGLRSELSNNRENENIPDTGIPVDE